MYLLLIKEACGSLLPVPCKLARLMRRALLVRCLGMQLSTHCTHLAAVLALCDTSFCPTARFSVSLSPAYRRVYHASMAIALRYSPSAQAMARSGEAGLQCVRRVPTLS